MTSLYQLKFLKFCVACCRLCPLVVENKVVLCCSPTIFRNSTQLLWDLPKISNFLWRAFSNALSTNKNIFRTKIIPNPLCALCGEHPETTEHCLLLCPWTSAVWFGSSLGYIPEKASITSLNAWLLGAYSNS